MEDLESLFDDWDDAHQLALTTPRASLSPAIARLQEIRREVSDLECPECADLVKEECLDYMDKSIDALIAFLGQKEDSEVNALMDESDALMNLFISSFTKLNLGQYPYN